VQTRRANKILLVEDHADTADVAARLLRGRGYDVVIAASIKSALTAAEGNEIDLALCDIGLPDGDGCDLMRELRAKYSMRGIALTGYNMDDDENRVEQAGFTSRLVKPIDFEALCRVVENVLATAVVPGSGTSQKELPGSNAP
jgi:CheY-like chemotaxis protein